MVNKDEYNYKKQDLPVPRYIGVAVSQSFIGTTHLYKQSRATGSHQLLHN